MHLTLLPVAQTVGLQRRMTGGSKIWGKKWWKGPLRNLRYYPVIRLIDSFWTKLFGPDASWVRSRRANRSALTFSRWNNNTFWSGDANLNPVSARLHGATLQKTAVIILIFVRDIICLSKFLLILALNTLDCCSLSQHYNGPRPFVPNPYNFPIKIILSLVWHNTRSAVERQSTGNLRNKV